jgi:hypothetical protein
LQLIFEASYGGRTCREDGIDPWLPALFVTFFEDARQDGHATYELPKIVDVLRADERPVS